MRREDCPPRDVLRGGCGASAPSRRRRALVVGPSSTSSWPPSLAGSVAFLLAVQFFASRGLRWPLSGPGALLLGAAVRGVGATCPFMMLDVMTAVCGCGGRLHDALRAACMN